MGAVGVLVIALDTPLEPVSAADATFATDNFQAGVLIGAWAKETLGAGAAQSFMLGDRGPRMLEAYDDGGAEVRSRLDIFVKDMGIVGDAARAAKLATPIAAAAEQLYLLGQAAGLEAADDSSVITVVAPSRRTRKDQS